MINNNLELSKTETITILNKFYSECVKFWEREGHDRPNEMALEDIRRLNHNPYKPCGEKLDKQGQKLVIDVISGVLLED